MFDLKAIKSSGYAVKPRGNMFQPILNKQKLRNIFNTNILYLPMCKFKSEWKKICEFEYINFTALQ